MLYSVLTGNVVDPSSAAVPGAQVEALNMATGVLRKTTTDTAGVYRFAELLPGVYKVTVKAANFGTFVTENLNLEANNTRRVDVQLTLKAQTESVTVSAAPPVLQTDRADVHTDLSSREISDLPLLASNGRNFQSAYRIVPGAGLLGENNSTGGNPQRAMTANVNGLSINNNNTRIDGAVDTYTYLPANVAYIPSSDAIESVNVTTNNFDAEQGMAGGLAANVIVKSGTNQFHGTAYEYHTDNHLRTRNYFRPAVVQAVKPKNIFNQYGGTFGGPIKKDKLFFFGAYEGTKIRTAGGAARSVEPNSIRGGDFSALLPAVGTQVPKIGGPAGSTVPFSDCNATPAAGCIYDPNTGSTNGTGRTAFPGNMIPTNRIDPAAAKMASLIPAPNVGDPNNPTNISNNFIPAGAPTYNLSRIDTKVNYVPNTKSMVFARYSISPALIFDPPGLGSAGGDATGGGQNGSATSRVQSVALGSSYQITPAMLWDINVGYTRLRLGATNVDIGSNFGSDPLPKGLGIPGTNGSDPIYGGIPAFQISSWANLGNANTGNPFLFRDNQYVTNSNLGWIKGRHDLRFGLEYYRSGINHFQPQGGTFGTPRGTFGFNGSVTALNVIAPPNTIAAPAANAYNSFAQFLLGLPQEDGKVTQNIIPNALRFTTWAWYARDRWQITPKLTFTYGVRWEYYPFATSDHTGAKFFDPTTGNVFIGGIGSVPEGDGVDVGHGLFAPRFGIAYRLQSKTVIRTGYGISVDPNNFRALRDTYPNITNLDYQGTSIFSGSFAPSTSLTGTNANLTPYPGLTTGIVLVPFAGFGNGVIRLPNNAGTTTVANPFHRGYAESYNLIVQHDFVGWVAEAGYVGTRGIRIPLGLNINPAPVGVTTALGASRTRLLNANPNVCPNNLTAPCWGDINAVAPFKVTHYDSLQSKLTRRLSGGSVIGFAYTYSKAIDYGENEGSVFHPFPANWGDNKALAGFDRTHNFQAYGVYELPFGHSKRWAQHGIANILAGGWQLNWILSRYSGVPLTVTTNVNPSNALGSTNTPNLVGPIVILGHVQAQDPVTGKFLNCALTDTSCQYFQASSFAQPASASATAAAYGTAGRNILRGPGFFDLDTGLLRTFPIAERVKFQFRVDAFAATNTPNFGNPNLNLSSPNFGVITSTASGPQFSSEAGNLTGQRTFWFSGKVIF
ncbi:MAG TPA: TonB-dependent receptor [Candidatus Acidoferrum sp.]|nr:TonB-dependent receptor [Candidatus Acidoferrum sp.]